MSAKKAKQPAKLFPQEEAVLRVLRKDKRASVDRLFRAAIGGKGNARIRHQRVGTIIWRINRKQKSFRVVPVPDRPRFYQLDTRS